MRCILSGGDASQMETNDILDGVDRFSSGMERTAVEEELLFGHMVTG